MCRSVWSRALASWPPRPCAWAVGSGGDGSPGSPARSCGAVPVELLGPQMPAPPAVVSVQQGETLCPAQQSRSQCCTLTPHPQFCKRELRLGLPAASEGVKTDPGRPGRPLCRWALTVHLASPSPQDPTPACLSGGRGAWWAGAGAAACERSVRGAGFCVDRAPLALLAGRGQGCPRAWWRGWSCVWTGAWARRLGAAFLVAAMLWPGVPPRGCRTVAW